MYSHEIVASPFRYLHGCFGAFVDRGFTPGKASNSIDVDIASEAAATIAGAPKLSVRYRGSSLAGSKLTLQIVATTVAYAKPRLGGSVEFMDIKIDVPTSTGYTQ